MTGRSFTPAAHPGRCRIHFRPNGRVRTAVLRFASASPATATHLPAAVVATRSEDDLNRWLRHAVSGTSLIVHLKGDERLQCARRIAWFCETCRRFDVELVVETGAITRRALELLRALGAERVRIDESVTNAGKTPSAVRKIRTLALALALDIAA